MKTKEELNAIKKEVEELKGKLAELTEEELEKIHGGALGSDHWEALCPICNNVIANGSKGAIPPTGGYCPICNRSVKVNIVS